MTADFLLNNIIWYPLEVVHYKTLLKVEGLKKVFSFKSMFNNQFAMVLTKELLLKTSSQFTKKEF